MLTHHNCVGIKIVATSFHLGKTCQVTSLICGNTSFQIFLPLIISGQVPHPYVCIKKPPPTNPQFSFPHALHIATILPLLLLDLHHQLPHCRFQRDTSPSQHLKTPYNSFVILGHHLFEGTSSVMINFLSLLWPPQLKRLNIIHVIIRFKLGS